MILLPELHVGRGIAVGAVTVFPVWSAGRPVRGLVTGSCDDLSVSELDGGPSVAALQVRNTGSRSALLLEGELLEGGWQTRALVRDLILAPSSRHTVEVSCVEQGRWGDQLAHQRRTRKVTPRVQMALRTDCSTRQGQVWVDVQRYEAAIGSTPTSSLAGQLDRLPASPRLARLAGQRGVLIGLGEQPLALELFGSARALATYLPALLEAAALDAALLGGATTPVPARRARRLMARLDRACVGRTEDDAGDGLAIGATTPHLAARGIATYDGQLAHLSVLNAQHPLMEMAAWHPPPHSVTALPAFCSPQPPATHSAPRTSSNHRADRSYPSRWSAVARSDGNRANGPMTRRWRSRSPRSPPPAPTCAATKLRTAS